MAGGYARSAISPSRAGGGSALIGCSHSSRSWRSGVPLLAAVRISGRCERNPDRQRNPEPHAPIDPVRPDPGRRHHAGAARPRCSASRRVKFETGASGGEGRRRASGDLAASAPSSSRTLVRTRAALMRSLGEPHGGGRAAARSMRWTSRVCSWPAHSISRSPFSRACSASRRRSAKRWASIRSAAAFWLSILSAGGPIRDLHHRAPASRRRSPGVVAARPDRRRDRHRPHRADRLRFPPRPYRRRPSPAARAPHPHRRHFACKPRAGRAPRDRTGARPASAGASFGSRASPRTRAAGRSRRSRRSRRDEEVGDILGSSDGGRLPRRDRWIRVSRAYVSTLAVGLSPLLSWPRSAI